MFAKRAAEEHGIPTSTLCDRINGKVVHEKTPGPKPYLSEYEETELCNFHKVCTDVGYGKTSEDVRLAFGEIKAKKVLINLGQVRLTSSRGLATLLSLMLEGEEEGLVFALCEVSEPCMIILNTMNIMEYIEGVEILDTVEDAIKWLNEHN